MPYPDHLLKLIALLRRFPGVGSRSAERFAFHLLTWPEQKRQELGDALKSTASALKLCETCGCLADATYCSFCDPTKRQQDQMCVIALPKDLFAIEESRGYTGLYHVLNGTLSVMDERGPNDLRIAALKERLQKGAVQEVILAFDSTLEGDATVLYLKQELAALPVKISRLAFGMPIGSAIESVDGGTLARALSERRDV